MSRPSNKLFTSAEVAKHAARDDIYLVVKGKVYNVTDFLDEHPGGEEVILESAGGDASEGFEDVGHSDDARVLLEKYYVGDLDTSDAIVGKKNATLVTGEKLAKQISASPPTLLSRIAGLIVPISAIVLAAVAYQYIKKA